MKTMKIKVVVAIVMVAIFISSSTAIASQCSPLDDDDKPAPIEVKVKVWELFRGWYLIWVTVKNLEDERIILGTGRPTGNIYIRSLGGPYYEWEKPGVTTMMIYPLFLRPHQEKIVYFALWNINWTPAPHSQCGYGIYGYLRSYEYKGELYPWIGDGPFFVSAS